MIQDYIIPLFLKPNKSYFIGTGFIFDRFLITAGHVVSDFRVYYAFMDNQFYNLNPYYWLIKHCPQDNGSEKDIAIYELDKQINSIELAEFSPEYDSEAKVICWLKNGENIRKISTECLIAREGKVPSFYEILTTMRISFGSSGSPVIQNNKIVGMLTQGLHSYMIDQEALRNDRVSPQILADIELYA